MSKLHSFWDTVVNGPGKAVHAVVEAEITKKTDNRKKQITAANRAYLRLI